MSEPSGQTTNCSLIGEIWLVSMAIPRVQPGLVDHGGFVSPCPGTTFYVRKDYSQHQARFHWLWSSLRHHIPPQQLTPVHPIYHSITRSQFNRSTFKLVPQNLLSIYAGTNWDDNELVTNDDSKSLSSKRVQLPTFFYTRHLDRMTWAISSEYAKLWNHSTHS